MQYRKFIGLAALNICVVSCGGHGAYTSPASDSTSTSSSSSSTNSSAFNFSAPAINTTHTYAKTIIDNLNSTINQSLVDTITSVNQDGSFVVNRQDPAHNSIMVNGTTYSIQTANISVNNSGQETAYTYTSTNGALVTCTYIPHAAGPNYPFSVGDAWSSSWNYSCGNSTPISYSQTGTVVDTESVTVPAGTFTTFKLQSTIVWTDANGTTHTDTRSTWRDVNGNHTTIKEVDTYVLTGVPPVNGYPVSITTVLTQ